MKKLTRRQFIKRARSLYGNKYDYSKVKYINNKINVDIICPIHGEFQQTPNSHLDNKECYKCGTIKTRNGLTSTTDEFIIKANKVHENKYDYSKSIYRGARKKLYIICKKHGKFKQIPNDHLSGKGCPKCNYSRGEAALEALFIKNNIKYEPQFKLPFYNYEYDFYLPDYNLLIEFHGRQHYEPVEIFGGIDEFKRILERDAFKRSLANEYKIQLIEIHYKNLNLFKEYFEQTIIKKY